MLTQSKALLSGVLVVSMTTIRAEDVTPVVDRVPGLGSTGLGTDTNLSEDDPFAPPSDGDTDLGEQFILNRAPQRTPIRTRFHRARKMLKDKLGMSRNEEE